MNFNRHLFQADQIGTIRQLAQRRQQRVTDGPQACGITRRIRRQHRRVVVAHAEIGELDQARPEVIAAH